MMCLIAATAAHAQGGGGGRRGGNRGGKGPPTSSPSPSADSEAKPAQKPPARIEIVGVITAIDAPADRVTIAYEQTDALNLPAGERPFVVAKDELLKGASVGEKVRFSLDSQQISTLQPFAPPGDSD